MTTVKELKHHLTSYGLKKGFPGGSVVKNLYANAEDTGNTGLIPGSGRSPGEANGNSLNYSCLENRMGRGVWQATVPGVEKSWTRLKRLSSSSSIALGTGDTVIDNAIYHQNFGDSKAWYLLKRVLLDNLLDQIDQRARIK